MAHTHNCSALYEPVLLDFFPQNLPFIPTLGVLSFDCDGSVLQHIHLALLMLGALLLW